MASEFRFDGVHNHQCVFIEEATGVSFSLPEPDPLAEGAVRLLDGDEVVIPDRYGDKVWSIRERRIIGRA